MTVEEAVEWASCELYRRILEEARLRTYERAEKAWGKDWGR